MIFLDANVPMYLVGAPHANRLLARALLNELIAARQRLVTDAEVLQEIVHRYSALRRTEALPEALQVARDLVDTIFPIAEAQVLRAAEIVRAPLGLSARDALHVAVMEQHGIHRIVTFDAAFDRWPGIERLPTGSA
ncbi:MAG TPA: type II toxin-antitoxin system VapC family toxin [Terriglobales bacterium]